MRDVHEGGFGQDGQCRPGARFHAIARGSALECAAILDVLLLFEAVTAEHVEQGKTLLSRVVAMLSKMCR